ncbi:nitrogen regulation protein NR(II) [Halovenus rubra]|uniref:Nitrogen regulation protein NR(II) n=2 Tax=Halovenus rubra TaxID=869890 RepID=A0ACC7E319_9EURY|nr:PAS domain-containing sensor histidine kinase [Halovenus rubra]
MVSSDSSSELQISTADLDTPIQSTEFFRSLVENGSDAIVSIDQNSSILYANQSVERVFGYRPEELIGEKLTVLIPDRYHDAHFKSVDDYLESGERSIDWNGIELPGEHKNGHEVQLSITFEEHSYDGQQVFSGIMRDVTAQVERADQLERQNERLERFASIVSHDLREPLQTARATLAVAQAGNEEALDELDEVFDRMDALIGDVLTLAKQGQTVGEPQEVALQDIVEDSWSIVGTEAATLETTPTLSTVDADPERLRTVFENLFRNAIEHGGENLTVRVGTLSDTAGFYIEDDGSGFEDSATETLFDYGYSTKKENTGFGLSIVEDIVRAHGWSLTAMTGADGGARFEVETQ